MRTLEVAMPQTPKMIPAKVDRPTKGPFSLAQRVEPTQFKEEPYLPDKDLGANSDKSKSFYGLEDDPKSRLPSGKQ
jgi:hypothetical protein